MDFMGFMEGYVHSIQSMGTVDGPGVRTVVFMSGCPLRCIYCHNPDTWDPMAGEKMSAGELAGRILRFKPYIKNGGVTFSGGEPCLQAAFLREVAEILKGEGLHVALDTSGCVYDSSVDSLLELTDLVLLDVKMTTFEDYVRYTGGGTLDSALDFLRVLETMKKDTWIRHVVVPGINDNKEDIIRLSGLLKDFSCITKLELLPFKKLCLEKYKSMGIPFLLEDTPQMDAESLQSLYKFY